MATIPEHIYKLRTFIKQHTDDSIYSDEFLYSLLKDGRNILLERENKKPSRDSRFHLQTVCMPLVIDTYHDCDCLPVDTKCKVLKSKFPLPKIINGRNGEIMTVMTIDGLKDIPYTRSIDLKNDKYSKTKAKTIKYGISNGYLVVFNTTVWKTVLIEALFEDPLSLSQITYCDDDGNDVACYSIADSEFPLKSSLDISMYQIIMDLLKLPLTIKEDDTNNTNPQR